MRLAILLSASVALASGAARADCPVVPLQITSVQPAAASSAVPLNGVIAFGTHPAFAPFNPAVTLSSGGAPVTGALVTGPGGIWLYEPDLPLAPSASYQVQIADLGSSGATAISSFVTGTTADLVDPGPPGFPTLDLVEYIDPTELPSVGPGVCRIPGYWDLHVAWTAAADTTPVVYALELELVDLQPEFVTPRKGFVTTGLSAELDIPQDSQATVWVYAINAAGRQSHTQPATIIAPIAPQHSHHGCSCEIGGESAPLLSTLAALGLLAFRRRRR